MEKQLEELLKKTGAVLKRDKTHLVYEFPNGKSVSLSKTPGNEWTHTRVAIAEVKRVSGYQEPKVLKSAAGRVKQGRFQEPVKELKQDNARLRIQEKNQSQIISNLQAQIAGLEWDLREAEPAVVKLPLLQLSLDDLKQRRRACLMCRLRDKWKTFRGRNFPLETRRDS